MAESASWSSSSSTSSGGSGRTGRHAHRHARPAPTPPPTHAPPTHAAHAPSGGGSGGSRSDAGESGDEGGSIEGAAGGMGVEEAVMRLTYCSIEAVALASEDVGEAAGEWGGCEEAVGVTGVLVYIAGMFFHVLEGPPAAVNALYLRIARDDRLGECFVINLEVGPAGTRLYPSFTFQLAESAPEVYSVLKDVLHSLSSSYQILERYLPPVVLYQLKQGLNPFESEPRIVNALVVFVGLYNTGSTAWLSDEHYPTFIVLLSELYEHVTSSIVRAGGEVVKFIGADVMICFPQADVLPALHALHNLHVLLTTLADRSSLPGATVVMGMCAGPVVELNIGSVDFEKLDYTLLGNVVNTASRFKSLAASLGVDIALAPAVAELIAAGPLDGACTAGECLDAAEWSLVSLGPHMLKGLSEPHVAYTFHPPSACTGPLDLAALPPRTLLRPRSRSLHSLLTARIGQATAPSSLNLLMSTIQLTSSPRSPGSPASSVNLSIDRSIAAVAERVDNALDNASFQFFSDSASASASASEPGTPNPFAHAFLHSPSSPGILTQVPDAVRAQAAFPRSPDRSDLARALQVTLSDPGLMSASPISGLQHLANRRLGDSHDSRRVDVASILARSATTAQLDSASTPMRKVRTVADVSSAASARAKHRRRSQSVSLSLPGTLLRVTFVSLLTAPLTDAEWDAEVATWTQANSAANITGLILRSSSGEVVMQILEGPPAAVEALYAAIGADTRHHHVTRVATERVSKRKHAGFGAQVFSFDSAGVASEAVIEHMVRLMLDTMLTSYVSLRGYTQKKVLSILQTGANPLEHYSHPVEALVLVTDILDFTRISEVVGLNADLVVELINTFLGTVISAVEAGGGSVNKLIGDCVVAFFPPDAHAQAATTALVIQRELAAIRASAPVDSILAIMYSGVGLAAGRVFLGNIGVSRLDFAMIGAPVDAAHELESATRRTPHSILMSAPFAAGLRAADTAPALPSVVSFALPNATLAASLDTPDAQWDVAAVQDAVNAKLAEPLFVLNASAGDLSDLSMASFADSPMSLHTLPVSPIPPHRTDGHSPDNDTSSDASSTGGDVDLNDLLADDASFLDMVTDAMAPTPRGSAAEGKAMLSESSSAASLVRGGDSPRLVRAATMALASPSAAFQPGSDGFLSLGFGSPSAGHGRRGKAPWQVGGASSGEPSPIGSPLARRGWSHSPEGRSSKASPLASRSFAATSPSDLATSFSAASSARRPAAEARRRMDLRRLATSLQEHPLTLRSPTE